MQDGVVCGGCGATEGVQVRSVDGQPRCTPCSRAIVRRERLEQINMAIRALVHCADANLADEAVVAAIVKTAWTIPKRAALLVSLDNGPQLNGSAFRSAAVARLIDTLRHAGSVIPAALCDSCTGPAEPLIASQGPVRCRACAKICPTCGRATKDLTHQTCRKCVECTRSGLLLDDDDRCRRCREAVVRVCVTCNSQGPLTDGRCHRCLLTEEFDQILGERPSPWLVALRSSVLKMANATSTQRWLHHTTSGRLLMSMARGEFPLSHDTLDQHTGRGIDHLRGLLITTGGLEPERRWIDQLADELHATLTILDDQRDRKVVGAWIRWHALPRLRRRAEQGVSTAHSGANLRRQSQQVVSFVAGVERRNRTLATCTQSDIDQWFARPGAALAVVRSFLAWAAKHKHTARELTLTRSRQAIGSGSVDSERRWQIARTLVTDDSVTDGGRVAGALLVLYAQSLTRIAALTIDDVQRVETGAVTITVAAGVAIELVETFATLILRLPARRREGIGDQFPSKWLFPGATPDRHVNATVLANRLRSFGIEPRKIRAAAMQQLAGEIPPAILAGTIGVSPGTAAKWAAIASGDYAASSGRSQTTVSE